MLRQTELTKQKNESEGPGPTSPVYQTYSQNQLQNSKALISMDRAGFGAFSSDYNNDSNPSSDEQPPFSGEQREVYESSLINQKRKTLSSTSSFKKHHTFLCSVEFAKLKAQQRQQLTDLYPSSEDEDADSYEGGDEEVEGVSFSATESGYDEEDEEVRLNQLGIKRGSTTATDNEGGEIKKRALNSSFKSKIPPPNPLLPKSVAPLEPAPFGGTNEKGGSRGLNYRQFKNGELKLTPQEMRQQIIEICYEEHTLRYLGALEFKTQQELGGRANPVVYSRYGKSSYSSTVFPYKSLEQFFEPNICDLKYLMHRGSPYKAHIQYLSPGEHIYSKPKLARWLGKLPPPYYTPIDENDTTLVFESRFEQGNLQLAVKKLDCVYDLVLQNDINTIGHTQWYYFRVQNTRKGMENQFNILNLAKPDSLYNDGMKVLIFSQKANEEDPTRKWFRGGYSISYYQNNYHRETGSVGCTKTSSSKTYYTFSFSYTFPYDNDTIYFAYCIPYGYTDLQRDLIRYEQTNSSIFHKQELCRTLANYKVDLVTITSPESAQRDKKNTGNELSTLNFVDDGTGNYIVSAGSAAAANQSTGVFNSEKAAAVAAARERQKKGVIITARVHPGETNGSWMMRGVLEFLMSDLPQARALRERFVFKVVPMINIDGVVHGNYRCSLAGCDLNRRYKSPSKWLHPEVLSLKKFAKIFSKERPLVLYCDMHGHSRRKNIFMYGNNNPNSPEQVRIFPFIMSKLLSYFSYEYSRFGVQKSKESTARISLWRELKIPTIYTMEASFCGADKGPLAHQHFTEKHLEDCGRKLCEALILFCNVDVQRTMQRTFQNSKKRSFRSMTTIGSPMERQEDSKEEDKEEFQELEGMASSYSEYKSKDLIKELMSNKSLLNAGGGGGGSGDVKSEGSSDAGSDDDPSGDNMNDEEIIKILPSKAKKKFQMEKRAAEKLEQKKKKEEERLAKEKQEELKKQAEKLQKQKELKKRELLQKKLIQDRNKKKKAVMVDAWTQTTDKEDNGGKDDPKKPEKRNSEDCTQDSVSSKRKNFAKSGSLGSNSANPRLLRQCSKDSMNLPPGATPRANQTVKKPHSNISATRLIKELGKPPTGSGTLSLQEERKVPPKLQTLPLTTSQRNTPQNSNQMRNPRGLPGTDNTRTPNSGSTSERQPLFFKNQKLPAAQIQPSSSNNNFTRKAPHKLKEIQGDAFSLPHGSTSVPPKSSTMKGLRQAANIGGPRDSQKLIIKKNSEQTLNQTKERRLTQQEEEKVLPLQNVTSPNPSMKLSDKKYTLVSEKQKGSGASVVHNNFNLPAAQSTLINYGGGAKGVHSLNRRSSGTPQLNPTSSLTDTGAVETRKTVFNKYESMMQPTSTPLVKTDKRGKQVLVKKFTTGSTMRVGGSVKARQSMKKVELGEQPKYMYSSQEFNHGEAKGVMNLTQTAGRILGQQERGGRPGLERAPGFMKRAGMSPKRGTSKPVADREYNAGKWRQPIVRVRKAGVAGGGANAVKALKGDELQKMAKPSELKQDFPSPRTHIH